MRAICSVANLIALSLVAFALSCHDAYAAGLLQVYTPEQVLTLGDRAVQQVAATQFVTDAGTHQGKNQAPRSLANGLYMVGNFTYLISGGNVTLTVDTINNDSFTRTSGTLRLDLWATLTQPARGGSITGYHLASSATLNPLSPRTFYSNVARTAAFSEPPAGTYWLVLVLSEFDTSCSGSYCVTDSGVFSNQRTFGAAPSIGNITIASQAGQQCYENYSQAAYSIVQQITPDLFQSYPGTVSCASLGMPFYTGLLATDTSVRVYAVNSTVGQLLCSTGLVTSCTNPPPSAISYTDIWWNPAESGWGVTITHHVSGNAFIAWYTYDTAGNPKWYVAPNCQVTSAGCTGTLYETNGPAFGTVYNPALVAVRSVGSVTFAFSGPTTGLMSYNVRGITGTKLITRQSF